jgi:hypothetical protein
MSYYFYEDHKRDYDFGCGLVLACAILLAVASFAVPWFLMGIGVFVVGRLVSVYLKGLRSALGIGKGPHRMSVVPEPPKQHIDGRDPAWPHYLYGPAKNDLRNAAGVIWPTVRGRVTEDFRWLWLKVLKPGDRNRIFRRPVGAVIGVGIIIGDTLAAAVIALLATWQITIWVLLVAVGFGVVHVLRGVDTVLLRLKGIRIFCQSCHQNVPYPVYACPNCARKHHDVRPGRYGMRYRICCCKERMPTLLLLGSAKMEAFCTACEEPMANNTGTAVDSVLPVLGSPQSGKTRLMLAIVMSLYEKTSPHGATAQFADDESKEAYERFVPALRNDVDTWKTLPLGDRPLRSYSVYVKPPKGRTKLLHVFDPPGEVVKTAAELQSQRFLVQARTFLFVLDPLSIPALWSGLDRTERKHLDKYRSQMTPNAVFSQVLNAVQNLGVDTGKARLAVAITKHDLLRDHVPTADGDGIRDWLESDEIGLDNMVRSMRKTFAEVTFFRTSARIDERGALDPNIAALTAWILRNEGLRLYN